MAKQNKKLVITSMISVALCGALLAGSSFAWFTDKVNSTNNTIESGKLDIVATDEKGTNLEELETGFITADNIEPGWSDFSELNITNEGTLAADVKVSFNIVESTTDVDLADVIWASLDGGETQFNIKDINEQIDSFEFQLLQNNGKSITITYGMDTEAGNMYQNLEFSMNVAIDAKQSVYEKDGFGSNEYDKDAEYDSIPADAIWIPTGVSAARLKEIVEENLDGYYVLTGDLDLGGESLAKIGGDETFKGTFDGNGHTISNVELKNCAMFGVIEGATIKNLTLKDISVSNKNGSSVAGLLAVKAFTQYEDTIISNVTVDNAYMTTSSTAALMIASSKGTAGLDRYQGTLIMDNVHVKNTVFRGLKAVSLFVYGYENGPKVKLTNSTVDNVYLDPGSDKTTGDVIVSRVDLEKLALSAKDDTYKYTVDDATLHSIYDAYSEKSIFNDYSFGKGQDYTSASNYDMGKITMSFEEYKALFN